LPTGGTPAPRAQRAGRGRGLRPAGAAAVGAVGPVRGAERRPGRAEAAGGGDVRGRPARGPAPPDRLRGAGGAGADAPAGRPAGPGDRPTALGAVVIGR